MSSPSDLISEVTSLPIEMRTKLVESLLKSLNPPHKEVDEMWAEVAEQRLQEVRQGRVKTIPGEEVFQKIKVRLSK